MYPEIQKVKYLKKKLKEMIKDLVKWIVIIKEYNRSNLLLNYFVFY